MEHIKVFGGTYNINAQQLSPEDASIWFENIETFKPDVIFLGFQECGYIPSSPFPEPLLIRPNIFGRGRSTSRNPQGSRTPSPAVPISENNILGEGKPAIAGDSRANSPAIHECNTPVNKEGAHKYLRGDSDSDSDCKFIEVIRNSLPDNYPLVADVAIGEPPTHGKVEINGKKTEWYGAIRVMVFVNSEFDPDPMVESLVIPTGNKFSSYRTMSEYEKYSSPDKGAVGVHLLNQNLLLLNFHLHGTNKYKVPEEEFDKERDHQLGLVRNGLVSHLGGREQLDKASLVCIGDFNFRVQVSAAPEDCEKGGLNYQKVHQIVDAAAKVDAGGSSRFKLPPPDTEEEKSASAGEGEAAVLALRALFEGSDRLHCQLSHTQPAEGAGSVKELRSGFDLCYGLLDGLDEAWRRNTGCAYLPTFTLVPGQVPRQYGPKRTPSWTDRVLWRGHPHDLLAFATYPEVVASDHVPVGAVLRLKYSPEMRVRRPAAVVTQPSNSCSPDSSRSIIDSSNEPEPAVALTVLGVFLNNFCSCFQAFVQPVNDKDT